MVVTPSAAEKPLVKLVNAALNEVNGDIVAHGWLDIDSMGALKVDTYQREVLARTGGKKTALQSAVENDTTLPDIVLGMRGQHYRTHGASMVLEDPVYIIDGLQRVFTLKQHAELHPDKAKLLRIGAEVRFDTDKQSEKELFHALNVLRTPMSPNVTLRNERDKNAAVLTLYGLSMSDEASPIKGRIQWNQRRSRGELMTALALCRVSATLHRHLGGANHTQLRSIANGLLKQSDKMGLRVFRNNVSTFFETIDECFGIRKIEFRQTATQLRTNFLLALSRLLSDHDNFWDGDKMVIDSATRRKLSSFPLGDPEIIRLSGAGTMAMPLLYSIVRDHLNKGKKINRLKVRKESASRDLDQD